MSCKSLHLGSLTPTRDLTFVEDAVMGFLAIAKSANTAGEIINIGMREEHSIANLVSMIAEILEQPAPKIKQDACRIRPKKSEVNRLFCDNSKIKKMTGWAPKYTLKSGLIKTIKWFKSNLNYYNPEIYNV
jgi:nucleoside-diphosphate-sugar epimerase